MAAKEYKLLFVAVAVLSCLGGAIGTLILSATTVHGIQKVVIAEEFVVVDRNGNRCAVLESKEDITSLKFFDGAGKVRLVLCIDSQGSPVLKLLDKYSNRRLEFGLASSNKSSQKSNDKLNPIDRKTAKWIEEFEQGLDDLLGEFQKEGTPFMTFFDEKGDAGISLSTTDDSLRNNVNITSDGLEISSEKNSGHVGLYLYKDGLPHMYFMDKTGKIRCMLLMDEDGSSSLNLLDAERTVRTTLGSTELVSSRIGIVEKRPESSLVLFDKDGKVIWSIP